MTCPHSQYDVLPNPMCKPHCFHLFPSENSCISLRPYVIHRCAKHQPYALILKFFFLRMHIYPLVQMIPVHHPHSHVTSLALMFSPYSHRVLAFHEQVLAFIFFPLTEYTFIVLYNSPLLDSIQRLQRVHHCHLCNKRVTRYSIGKPYHLYPFDRRLLSSYKFIAALHLTVPFLRKGPNNLIITSTYSGIFDGIHPFCKVFSHSLACSINYFL